MSSSKTILIILPKLTGYGGLQLENIGFINALCKKTNLRVKVFTIDINKESKALINNRAEFFSLKMSLVFKCFSIWFLKLLFRTNFNFQQSVRIYLGSYPKLINTYLVNETKENDIIFCSLHPQNLVQHVHQFCNLNNRQFIFHQISKPHPKYDVFYKSLTEKDTVLISSYEKYSEIKKRNPKPKFLNIKQWIYTDEDKFLNLKKHSSKNNKIVFGIISRLDKEKNVMLLLKAVNQIKNYDFKVIIFGNGKNLNTLKDFADNQNITDKVYFKGSIEYNNRHKAYAQINVFICTSVNEGGPITVLEAMASEIPVISTNVGDVPNRIINEYNGYVLKDNDSPIELSELMLNYINNPKLIKEHGKNGRVWYKNEYHSQVAKGIFVNSVLEN